MNIPCIYKNNDKQYLECITRPVKLLGTFSNYEYRQNTGKLHHQQNNQFSPISIETAIKRAELLDSLQKETCNDPKKCKLKNMVMDLAQDGCEFKHPNESEEKDETVNACIVDKLEQKHASECSSTGLFKPDSELCKLFKTRECMKKECSNGQCTPELCNCCNGGCIWNRFTMENDPCTKPKPPTPQPMTVTEPTAQPLEPNAIQYTDQNLCSEGKSCGLNEMLRENERCQNIDQTTHLNMACFDEVYKKFSGPCSDPLGTNDVDPNSGICKQLNKTYGCVKMCLEGKVLKEPFQHHDTSSSIPIFPFIFACIGASILIYIIKTF